MGSSISNSATPPNAMLTKMPSWPDRNAMANDLDLLINGVFKMSPEHVRKGSSPKVREEVLSPGSLAAFLSRNPNPETKKLFDVYGRSPCLPQAGVVSATVNRVRVRDFFTMVTGFMRIALDTRILLVWELHKNKNGRLDLHSLRRLLRFAAYIHVDVSIVFKANSLWKRMLASENGGKSEEGGNPSNAEVGFESFKTVCKSHRSDVFPLCKTLKALQQMRTRNGKGKPPPPVLRARSTGKRHTLNGTAKPSVEAERSSTAEAAAAAATAARGAAAAAVAGGTPRVPTPNEAGQTPPQLDASLKVQVASAETQEQEEEEGGTPEIPTDEPIDNLPRPSIAPDHIDAFMASLENEKSAVSAIAEEDPAETAKNLFESLRAKEYEVIYDVVKRNVFDPDMVDAEGNTVLHVVAQNGDLKMAKLAVSLGCKVNAMNNAGNTPLHYAFDENDLHMGTWLCENGAKDTIINKLGNPCYDGIE